MQNKTMKQQSFSKIHKKNQSRNQKRENPEGNKSTTGVTEKKGYNFLFCFFFYTNVCLSVRCSLARLQDARRGEPQQAAVTQPRHQGQQRGQACRPSGDSRVSQDGVGRTWTVYLRVLRKRDRGTEEFSLDSNKSQI